MAGKSHLQSMPSGGQSTNAKRQYPVKQQIQRSDSLSTVATEASSVISGISPNGVSSSKPTRVPAKMPTFCKAKYIPSVHEHGYGDATPAENFKYEYSDAPPDNNVDYDCGDVALDAKSKYGYDDASPDEKVNYGYSDGCPSISSSPRKQPRARRSSMKSGCGSSTIQRRASIQMGGEYQVQIHGREELVRRRCSITFDEKVRIRKVAPMASLTTNPEHLWFQDAEYDQIQRRSWTIIDKIEAGEEGAQKYCTRGLERIICADYIKQKKHTSWDSVLDEQDLQRKQAKFDDENMANIYRDNTSRCQQEATRRAQKDAKEIKTYLRSTRKYCRRLSM